MFVHNLQSPDWSLQPLRMLLLLFVYLWCYVTMHWSVVAVKQLLGPDGTICVLCCYSQLCWLSASYLMWKT